MVDVIYESESSKYTVMYASTMLRFLVAVAWSRAIKSTNSKVRLTVITRGSSVFTP